MHRKHTVQIVDTTLREGQQHGQVRFTTEQAIHLATALDDFGVDILEIGHPLVSEQDRATAQAICQLTLKAETLAHARARQEDILAAKEVGADWVGIFISVNEEAEKYKLKRSFEDILILISEAVAYAKSLKLKVRLTCEDASRTSMLRLRKAYQSGLDAGADRLSYADTVGILTPPRAATAIKTLTQFFGPKMHIHCHNDLGLAVASTLGGFEGGAVGLDASLGGLGERCGITPLEQLTTAMAHLFRLEERWKLERLVAMHDLLHSMLPAGATDVRPIVGKYAFCHKAGLHINAAVQYPYTYEPFPPEMVGQERSFSSALDQKVESQPK